MEKMMYLAAQYLAAAGISFLAKKDDDSHTNLDFTIGNASLNSRPLSKAGDQLSLNYERFTLEWRGPEGHNTFRLDGSTHLQIVSWIREQVSRSAIDRPYNYNFHYELPYKIEDNFTFKLLDANKLSELTHLRILTHLVLENFLNKNSLNSEIRVWPHHFDTGAYSVIDKHVNTFVGLGLAVPDSVVSEHYFYISVYKDNKVISAENLEPLISGHWHNDGFIGGVLPAMGATVQTATSFYEEALEALVNN